MYLLRHPFLLPFFVQGALGNFDTFRSLCPDQDGKRVSLSAGEYKVSCGGHFDWSVTGVRVDWQGAASPEECARLCSGSVDCDAMVFDGQACWEYSARGETLEPVVDPRGNTILLEPFIKTDPNDPNKWTPQPPPPLTPAQLQRQLDECIQDKGHFQNGLQTLKYTCEQDKQVLTQERETCRQEQQTLANQRDACVLVRDQYKGERDECRNPPIAWYPSARNLQCKQNDHTIINTGKKRFKLRCGAIYRSTDVKLVGAKLTYADCLSACQSDDWCGGFVWNRPHQYCRLFPSVAEHELDFDNVISSQHWAGVTA